MAFDEFIKMGRQIWIRIFSFTRFFPVFCQCRQPFPVKKADIPVPHLNQPAQEAVRRNNANPFHKPVHTRFLDHLVTIWNAEFFFVIMKTG